MFARSVASEQIVTTATTPATRARATASARSSSKAWSVRWQWLSMYMAARGLPVPRTTSRPSDPPRGNWSDGGGLRALAPLGRAFLAPTLLDLDERRRRDPERRVRAQDDSEEHDHGEVPEH